MSIKHIREQGFDSMMSGEFLSLMEKHIGSELKMEIIHLHNTPKELHQYLIDTYYGGGEIDTNTSSNHGRYHVQSGNGTHAHRRLARNKTGR
jgi:hypothetical protein